MKEKLNRVIAGFLIILITLGAVPFGGTALASTQKAVKGGNCGTNLTWMLDEKGTLTVSGTGTMWTDKKVWWSSYRDDIKKVIIADGVTSIRFDAFYGCKNLKSVAISRTVSSIENGLFSGCISLKSITVDKRNPVYDSRENCNAVIETSTDTIITGCNTSTIPDSVTNIGLNAFSGCKGLTDITIPGSVTGIDSYAFANCTGLTGIRIPGSVTSIKKFVFKNCTSLESITIDSGNTVYDSRENCNAVIETSTNTMIAGCKASTIPGGVTCIRKSAFCECSSLTDITIPGSVTDMEEGAFRNCTGLTAVTVADGVKSISEFAFCGCTALKSIALPDSVTDIGNSAFYGCTALESVKISSGVTSIGSDVFYGCTNLTDITVDGDNPVFDSAENCNAVIETKTNTLIIGCKNTTIPSTVTTVGDYAFSGCTSLKSIKIPGNVTYINAYAFSGCTGLKSITLPRTVTSIGLRAFDNCPGLLIMCYNNCCAHLYAKKNHLKYQLIPTCKKHTYKENVTKATFKKAGKTVTKCTVCGVTKSTATIPYVKSIKLSKERFAYDGKAKKPTVTVKDSKGKVLKKDRDYTVKYSSACKKIGSHYVTVKLKGKYAGTNLVSYQVVVKAPSFTTLKPGKGKATLKWKAVKGATGYQVFYYSTAKDMYIRDGETKKTSYNFTGLASGKTYKVKVRAYHKGDGQTVFSAFSPVKKVKAK